MIELLQGIAIILLVLPAFISKLIKLVKQIKN